MQRDMELIRNILFDLEKKKEPGWCNLEYDGYTKDQVSYHIKLAYQAGLIEARDVSTFEGMDWWAGDLTWQGHEFLDAVRNDTVWNKVKNKVAEQGGNLPFDIVKALAIKFVGNIVGI